MSQKFSPAVVKAVMIMAEIYGKDISEAAARMFIEDLSTLPEKSVLLALDRCRRELRFFPTAADVLSRTPECAQLTADEAGPLIAGKILEAITRIGPHRAQEFMDHVGLVGGRVVQLSGGITAVCSIETREVTAHRAQWTKLAVSLEKMRQMGQLDDEQPKRIAEAASMRSLSQVLIEAKERGNEGAGPVRDKKNSKD